MEFREPENQETKSSAIEKINQRREQLKRTAQKASQAAKKLKVVGKGFVHAVKAFASFQTTPAGWFFDIVVLLVIVGLTIGGAYGNIIFSYNCPVSWIDKNEEWKEELAEREKEAEEKGVSIPKKSGEDEKDKEKKENEKKAKENDITNFVSTITSPFTNIFTTTSVSAANKISFDELKPHVKKFGEVIEKEFPKVKDIGGFRPGDPEDHGKGLALDVMTYEDTKLGDKIAEYAVKNMEAGGITYIIWKQKFYMGVDNKYGKANTWEPMEDRGSITQNHFDHVHISFDEKGGTGKFSSGGGGSDRGFDGYEDDFDCPRIGDGTENGRSSGSGGGGGKKAANAGYLFNEKYCVTQGYGQYDGGGQHDGIDISAKSGEGAPIFTPVDGEVTFSGVESLGGIMVSVKVDGDPGGTIHFGHLVQGSNKVKVGDKVKAGDQIGEKGNTGMSTGPHLHFQWNPDNTWGAGDHKNPFPFMKGVEKEELLVGGPSHQDITIDPDSGTMTLGCDLS